MRGLSLSLPAGNFRRPTKAAAAIRAAVAVMVSGLVGGAVAPADAALFSSDDTTASLREARPTPHQRRRAARHISTPGPDKGRKEASKPQGPLIIAISIERQQVKVYDANGLYAESPVSTGMRGHPTPMGVFSIIQKHKWHRSNIYSGAPMPYMQRITWSGVAMHAGVLPGYPASHGCIRMPAQFAVRMWEWTRMGARVIVTPGEVSPANFAHPLLATRRPEATPIAAIEPQATVTVTAKSDRSEPAVLVRTADAGAAMPSETVALSDARPSTAKEAAADVAPTDVDGLRAARQSADKAAEAFLAAGKADDSAPAQTAAIAETQATAPPATAPEMPEPIVVAAEPHPDRVPAPATAEAEKPASIAAEPDKDAAKITAKDQGRLDLAAPAKAEPSKTEPAAKAEPPKTAQVVPLAKRAGHVAAFVSRKDGKLYVRQNFAPLFDAPVTIAASDRPLGSHVFTGRADPTNPGPFLWSAVSLPAANRRVDSDDRAARRRKATGAIEVKAAPLPDSPAEALDRITIPPEAAQRLAALLAPGDSLVISDQGIAVGETGEGTDFILALR